MPLPQQTNQVQDSPALPTEEPTGTVKTELQDPAPGQVEHHQQEPPVNQPPVVIAPTGYTRTGHQVCCPARFAYAAYH